MLFELFYVFLKIGLFTFGGGFAMIPLIEEQVINKGWMSEQQLVEFIAVCESTPGSFTANIATYIGLEVAGFTGALVATIAVTLPSCIIICIIAKYFEKFKENKIVKYVMKGLKPAVVALILSSTISIFKNVFIIADIKKIIISTIVAVIAIICNYKKISPIYIIAISAVLGIVLSMIII